MSTYTPHEHVHKCLPARSHTHTRTCACMQPDVSRHQRLITHVRTSILLISLISIPLTRAHLDFAYISYIYTLHTCAPRFCLHLYPWMMPYRTVASTSILSRCMCVCVCIYIYMEWNGKGMHEKRGQCMARVRDSMHGTST